MASEFDNVLAGKSAVFMDHFGEDVSYTPQGGATKAISAIVRRETRSKVSLGSEELDYDEMLVEIRGDSDTLGETTPKEFGEDAQSGDTLLIDSETWYVAEILGRKPMAGWLSLRVKTKPVSDPQDG